LEKKADRFEITVQPALCRTKLSTGLYQGARLRMPIKSAVRAINVGLANRCAQPITLRRL
jgi:hypothetical protein